MRNNQRKTCNCFVTITLILASCLGVSKSGYSQIDQNNWLFGGSSSFAFRSYNGVKDRYLTVQPRIGYLLLDRLAAGLTLTYERETNISPSGKNIYRNFFVGPFLRYYLLPTARRINILAEGSYHIGENYLFNGSGKQTNQALSFALGPTIFLNNSVGLELIGSYVHALYNRTSTTKSILLNVGFQFYLERDTK